MTYSNSPTPPGPLSGEATRGNEYRYAPFQRRLGAIALDSLIYFFTLGIGWTIWAFIVRGKGQTPGKKILKLRVLNFETGAVANRWHMTIREFSFHTQLELLRCSQPASLQLLGVLLRPSTTSQKISAHFVTTGSRPLLLAKIK